MKTTAAINIKHLDKKYMKFKLEVDNLSIPKGFATALIGENGAGKTTIMNVLAGINLRYKGEITYFDKWNENEAYARNSFCKEYRYFVT